MDMKSAAVLGLGLIAASALIRFAPSPTDPRPTEVKAQDEIAPLKQRLDELERRGSGQPQVYGLDSATRQSVVYLIDRLHSVLSSLRGKPSDVGRYQLVRATDEIVI